MSDNIRYSWGEFKILNRSQHVENNKCGDKQCIPKDQYLSCHCKALIIDSKPLTFPVQGEI